MAKKSEPKNTMRKKADLPQKICASCHRPFSWRKKWKDNWDQVKYCSQRCQGKRAQPTQSADCNTQ